MYALVMNFNESYKFSTLWHFLHVTWIGWYPLHFKRSVKSSGVLFRHYEWCWKILSPVKNPLQKKQCLFIYVLSSDMILASLLYFLAYWWGGGASRAFVQIDIGGKEMYLSRASVQTEHRIWNWFVDFIFLSLFIINPTFSNI